MDLILGIDAVRARVGTVRLSTMPLVTENVCTNIVALISGPLENENDNHCIPSGGAWLLPDSGERCSQCVQVICRP